VEKIASVGEPAKPSKRALQLGFYGGLLTISERNGMLKTYELMARHSAGTGRETRLAAPKSRANLPDRALGAQGLVSLDFDLSSRCAEQAVGPALDRSRVRRNELGAGPRSRAQASRNMGRCRERWRPPARRPLTA